LVSETLSHPATSSFDPGLQALAALSLALATNDSAYYAEAYSHYSKYGLSGAETVLNWDSKVPAVYLLFNQVATARPNLAESAGLGVNRTGWQTEIERYLDQAIGGKGQAYYTKGLPPTRANKRLTQFIADPQSRRRPAIL
jgi:hypothetical protein